MSNEGGADAAAFARLYAEHHRVVLRYVARRVGPDDAEDVTAEVFLVAWRRWPAHEPAALPWLYTTAQLTVANHLRGLRRYDQAVQHLATVAGRLPGVAEESADRVAAARGLLALSEPDRELLLAVAWDGLSTAQLAGVLGCTVPTAYVRLHRARRRLAAHLEDDPQETAVEQSR